MSTLYIRLPSKAAADSATDRLALACQFALVSHGKTIEQQGAAPLAELSGTIARAQRVVLLLAASDVTLLRVKAPPLSHARLKAALPNLVEDQLIGDPSDCVVVAGSVADGLRTVAVAQRDWLDTLSRTLIACGARQIAALPAQLCLRDESMQSGSVLAAFSEQNNGIDLALRLSEHEGIGLAIDVGQNEVATHEAIRALCAVVPEAQVTLYVSQASVLSCQNEINNSGALNKRINVHADNWSRWIAGASNTTLDLMAGMGAGALPRVELRAWRWPLVLAAAVLAINIAALNFDWWRMRNEAKSLRAAMTEIYKSAFPKETVIIDPVAQMLQKIAAAKRAAGLPTADDFTAITAAFGEAWASAAAASGNAPAIAELEYRERSLFVRFKPGMEAPVQQMKTALAERNLTLEQES
ncbi:MAG: type II secretion system protein GspL, partial [Gallionella sp.]|nr:type II secretion system protein GspL [Gallionella sp.]